MDIQLRCYNSCRIDEDDEVYCETCYNKLKEEKEDAESDVDDLEDELDCLQARYNELLAVAIPLYKKLQRPQDFKVERKAFVDFMKILEVREGSY